MKRLIILAFTLGLAVTGVVHAKETGTTRSAVDLMATPYRDAKPAGQLPSNTMVDILERRGGWLRISAQGKTGWARLHQVRAGEGPEAKKSAKSAPSRPAASMIPRARVTSASGAEMKSTIRAPASSGAFSIRRAAKPRNLEPSYAPNR